MYLCRPLHGHGHVHVLMSRLEEIFDLLKGGSRELRLNGGSKLNFIWYRWKARAGSTRELHVYIHVSVLWLSCLSLRMYVYMIRIYLPSACWFVGWYFRPNHWLPGDPRHRDLSVYDIGGLGRSVSEKSLHRGQRSKRQITITMRTDFSPCNDFNFPSTAPGLDVNKLHQNPLHKSTCADPY